MEYKNNSDEKSIYHIEVVNDDLFNIKGHINGPKNSPFEGGVFKIEAKIPKNYPFSPPSVKFVTRIWHPNICKKNIFLWTTVFN